MPPVDIRIVRKSAHRFAIPVPVSAPHRIVYVTGLWEVVIAFTTCVTHTPAVFCSNSWLGNCNLFFSFRAPPLACTDGITSNGS